MKMVELKTRNEKLYIDEQEVIRGWESFSGWYWFATEMVEDDWNGRPLWFGYVQGTYPEWGNFSETELLSIPSVWEIKPQDLPHAGRRD
jgi:hypothetical protein